MSKQRPGSGTEWEKLRDSGSLDPRVNFAGNPFQFRRWRIAAALIALVVDISSWVVQCAHRIRSRRSR